MQDRLAVEADHVDAGRVDTVGIEEGADRVRMQRRHHLLSLPNHARPLVAAGQAGGGIHRRAQQGDFVFAIGMQRGRPEAGDGFAVGFDHGDIDAVHGRAAHQPDRAIGPQNLPRVLFRDRT
jgi:hypothetical protein